MNDKITPELAEFLGIMVGDGNIYISKDENRYRLIICGHLKNDYIYLNIYVKRLVDKLFNKPISKWVFRNKNSFAISVNSKGVIKLLVSLGLKVGKKSQIATIPICVLKSRNKKIKASFLRGIADTDFSVAFHKGASRIEHTYPIITGATSSKNLAFQIKKLLKEFKINTNINIRRNTKGFSKVPQYYLYIYGEQNLEKWMKFIGFSNPNHFTKINLWKKFGFYLPNTSIKERLILLTGKEVLSRYMTASSLLAGDGRLAA